MRRAAALAFIPLLAVAAVAGCGSSSSSKPKAAAPADTYKSVVVTGGYGTAPKVTIPKAKPSGALFIKTITQGTGPAVTSADGVYGNTVVYDWSGTTSKLLGSAYSASTTQLLSQTDQGPLIKGVAQALVGQKVGSRVLAVIPPADGLGSNGTQEGIGANDTLVFVIDLKSTYSLSTVPGSETDKGGGALPIVVAPATAAAGPTVTINTKAKPPTKLEVKTVIKGTGAAVASGAEALVNYNGYIWRTGKSFQSSWTNPNAPFPATLSSSSGLIAGWTTGLVGQTVGSRVMLVIPPAEGYGKSGNSEAGIKATDTLVFVIDILAATKA
jgi:peptidylprolyl isomerase